MSPHHLRRKARAMAGSVEKMATGTARSDVGVPCTSCRMQSKVYNPKMNAVKRQAPVWLHSWDCVDRFIHTSGHRATT